MLEIMDTGNRTKGELINLKTIFIKHNLIFIFKCNKLVFFNLIILENLCN